MSTHDTSAAPAPLDDDDVAAFLRDNPDFLVRRKDLLGALDTPDRFGDDGDGVVDMQRFMVERLRGEIDHLRSCTNELLVTSRANMTVQTRTHSAVLALLAAADLGALLRTVADDLPLILDVDVAVIGFETATPLPGSLDGCELRVLPHGMVDALLADSDVSLRKSFEDDGTLFGAGSGLVRSAALARLAPWADGPAGMLALGSRSHGTFHPGQGTDLLGFLARVLERAIERCPVAG